MPETQVCWEQPWSFFSVDILGCLRGARQAASWLEQSPPDVHGGLGPLCVAPVKQACCAHEDWAPSAVRPLTVRNLKPRVEMRPARKPAVMAPKGVSIISPAVPTTTPPARAAFWMWTWRESSESGGAPTLPIQSQRRRFGEVQRGSQFHLGWHLSIHLELVQIRRIGPF